MQSLREFLSGLALRSLERGSYCCYDSQLRPKYHGPEERYVDPESGRCRPLVVQAVHPRWNRTERVEVRIKVPADTGRLAIWLVLNLPYKPEDIFPWLALWTWFALTLICPFDLLESYTAFYPPYLSGFYGQLWVARSPREYSLRKAQLGEEPVREVTHATHPRQLVIYHPESQSWNICSDENIIKQQKYVAISFPYEVNIPRGLCESNLDRNRVREEFIKKVEATVASLHETAYWMDLQLVDSTITNEEVNQDLYRMADVYRGAQFTLIMLHPPAGVTEEDTWLKYGERLWTFPEALLSRELRFQFRDGGVTHITLHQLANRAYAHFAQESAIVNAYALHDPLERLERLSLLKSALWRRTSGRLTRNEVNFRADRVYALMGFFEHRIHPHHLETQLQAFVRLSMANDNDRIVERMVSLLPSEIPDDACWNAEEDAWGANLWDIEPEIQVVGMTETNALVLGGCRAAAIRWKDFPSVAFATRRSIKRMFANYVPYIFWELHAVGIALVVSLYPKIGALWTWAVLIATSILIMGIAPFSIAYGNSGRIVQAQPWLIGVKGLISAEEASTYLYGGAIFALPRTFYSPSGTTLAKTHEGRFRSGDPAQLEELRTAGTEADDLYTLVDTMSATIYYFRARRPPTVCLYTGRESGLGRFVLCSERCTINELHKETVIRMPWYISQWMCACDWVALN